MGYLVLRLQLCMSILNITYYCFSFYCLYYMVLGDRFGLGPEPRPKPKTQVIFWV